MNRILLPVMLVFVAISAFASDRWNREPHEMFIATTGRIIGIDTAARTIVVRGSEGNAVPQFSVAQQKSSNQTRAGISSAVFARGSKISLGTPQLKRASDSPNLNEYTVVTTHGTLFRDGADPIRFEDFTIGETISIHGFLNGATLKASRLSKWS